jgi:iron(III) transport system permease protein
MQRKTPPVGERALKTAAWIVSLLCLAPIVAVAFAAVSGTLDTWNSLMATVLPRYAWTTVELVVLVGIGTAVVGTATAWLVTTCRFPSSRMFEIVLALPLAFPAYVLAYAYTDLLDHPGPVQTALRAVTGWGPRDYWFPEIRSLGGAALMLIFVLYPYVYLLARAAFLTAVADGLFRRAHDGARAVERLLPRQPAGGAAGDRRRHDPGADGDHRRFRHGGAFRRADLCHRHLPGLVLDGRPGMAASQLAFCLMLAALFFVALEQNSAAARNTTRPATGSRRWRRTADRLAGAGGDSRLPDPGDGGFMHPARRPSGNGGVVRAESVRIRAISASSRTR